MTFTAWLRRQRSRHDPVGDLARDAGEDGTWPRARSREALESYLAALGASDGAIAALDRAWLEYEAAVSEEARA